MPLTDGELLNNKVSQDPQSPSGALTKRIRSMLTKIDSQLQDYDSRVGSSLQMISCDPQGRISAADLQKALNVIKHKPDAEVADRIVEKLDVDKDGFVELEHVLGLVRQEGLGMIDDSTIISVLIPFIYRYRVG